MSFQDSDLASALSDRIWEHMVHEDDSTRIFFPNSGWDGLLTEDEVKATLRKCGPHPVPLQDLVDFILKKASKIFAILITMEQPKLITVFYENDHGQEKLPVKLESVRPMLKQAHWGYGLIKDFCGTKQWWFTAPTFTTDQFRYDFEKFYHLPFTTAGIQAGKPTNYSTVEARSIHIDHVELRPDQVSTHVSLA